MGHEHEYELIILDGADAPETDALVERLEREDFLAQLLRREGRVAELATEDGDIKLDWVDGVEKALSHPEWLAALEQEAAHIIQQGIRHVIWAGMGGSVQTVYTLKRMGYLDSDAMTIYIHPLDSTDPASLNRLLREIASRGGQQNAFRELLEKTMMIGVSMGMTSEEPITHLQWYDGLLREFGVSEPERHIQVMTLPGSYLDQFARFRGSKMLPIQLDGQNHTPGRMSAPATRVFLRPVALTLVSQALARNPKAVLDGSLVRSVLERCQALYRLSHTLTEAERAELIRCDAFVRLGAFISSQVNERGRNKLVLILPEKWEGFAPWLEQLVEESLGKGGKGFLIFYAQSLLLGDDLIFLHFCTDWLLESEAEIVAKLRAAGQPVISLKIPATERTLQPPSSPSPYEVEGRDVGSLGVLAALFAGFKLTVAAFAYLNDIVFVGQPAVEAYKRYARELREHPAPVTFPTDTAFQARFGFLTLYYNSLIDRELITPRELNDELTRMGFALGSACTEVSAPEVYAAILRLAQKKGALGYKDFTFNGEITPPLLDVLEEARRELVNGLLRVCCKIRTAPSDYHSTEQSEVDGPPELVSTRLVALSHEPVIAGNYSDKFLLAQARGTWKAMEDARRWILMLTMPSLEERTIRKLRDFFREVKQLLETG